MKIACINDTHFGSRNDSIALLDYFDKFYTDFFFPILQSEKINTIIHLGDLWDRRKYVNFFTLFRAKQIFFNKIKENNLTAHFLVGNHDTVFKNTSDINSLELLLPEYSTNMTTYINPTVVEFDGLKIQLIPWVNADNIEESMLALDRSTAEVAFGHLEIYGFEMHKGSFMYTGFDRKLFEKFDIVASGHFHHRSTQDNIHYLGAPYEMNWNDFEDDRGFHIFDTATRKFEYHKNPLKMFNKIHYDDEGKTAEQLLDQDFLKYKNSYVKLIIRNKLNPYWFDLFVDKLESVGLVDLQIVEDHLNLNLKDDSNIISEVEDTVAILNKYVDQLEFKTDKNKLKAMLIQLHNEALNEE
jgi:predicted phosphodiesterase